MKQEEIEHLLLFNEHPDQSLVSLISKKKKKKGKNEAPVTPVTLPKQICD